MGTKDNKIYPLLGGAFSPKQINTLNVALVFNGDILHTTGYYVRDALNEFCTVTVIHPRELSEVDKKYDLYLVVDDGSHYVFPCRLKPSAIWLIDTHLTFGLDVIMALNFDYVFAAQKKGAEKLIRCGLTNSFWLPLACDPYIHGGQVEPADYSVGFVGHTGYGERKKLLEAIKIKYSDSFIGTAKYTEIGSIYSRSKLVFNRSINNDVNMRVFEGMCSGTIVLTDYVESIDELFKDGKHLIYYYNYEDAFSKIEEILKKSINVDEIANVGKNAVNSFHAYRNRVISILEIFTQNKIMSNRLILALRIVYSMPALQKLLLKTSVNRFSLFWLDFYGFIKYMQSLCRSFCRKQSVRHD